MAGYVSRPPLDLNTGQSGKLTPKGNFLEFLPILSILKSKFTAETLPYNVVIPSLAGYAFSSAPVDKSIGTFDAARVVHKLMMLLGLKGYVAQGGDIGSAVARYCVTHHEECRGKIRTSSTIPPPIHQTPPNVKILNPISLPSQPPT